MNWQKPNVSERRDGPQPSSTNNGAGSGRRWIATDITGQWRVYDQYMRQYKCRLDGSVQTYATKYAALNSAGKLCQSQPWPWRKP